MKQITYYYKLVRDNIPNIIIDSGKKCTINDYRKRKVVEELEELKAEVLLGSNTKAIEEELCDVLESISYFLYGSKLNNYVMHNLKALVEEKREEKGAFDNNIILVEVTNGEE